MADGVHSISTGKLMLLINSGVSPAVLRMVKGDKNEVLETYTYVIMPIKN